MRDEHGNMIDIEAIEHATRIMLAKSIKHDWLIYKYIVACICIILSLAFFTLSNKEYGLFFVDILISAWLAWYAIGTKNNIRKAEKILDDL